MSIVNLDWKLIASIEANDILNTLNYETIQYLISNISLCNIEAEMDASLDSYFIKVFKLSQNIIKYLDSVQHCLLKQIKDTSEELDREKTEKIKLQNDVENKFRKKISNLKSELQLKEELLESQFKMMKRHQYQQSTTKQNFNNHKNHIYPCILCGKLFESKSLLQSHRDRRHPGSSANLIIAPSQTSQTQSHRPKDMMAHNHLHQNKNNNIDSLTIEVSELKSRLKALEEENVNLKVKLQGTEMEAKEGMRESQMRRLEKEELMRRKINEEFDTKLELLKEEQRIENRLCFDRLQNSFMNEVKLMHVRQMEVSKVLDDVKRMRLPGDCLGILEDDDDDDGGGKTTSKINNENVTRMILKDKMINKPRIDACKFQERTSKFSENSTEDSTNNKHEDRSHKNTFIKNVTVTQTKNSVEPLKLIPTNQISEEPSFKKLAEKIIKESGRNTSTKTVDNFNDVLKAKSPESPEEIEDDAVHQTPSLEDAKRIIDMELNQRLAFYGVPNDCLQITAHKYLQIIERINSELVCLSSKDQERYLIFKKSLESDLESFINEIVSSSQTNHYAESKDNKSQHSTTSEITTLPLKNIKSDDIIIFADGKLKNNHEDGTPISISMSLPGNVSSMRKKDENLKETNSNDDQVAKTTSVNNNKGDADNDEYDDDDYDITTITESDTHKMTDSEDEGTLPNSFVDEGEDNNINNVSSADKKRSKVVVNKNERKSVSVASSIWSSADGESLHIEDLDDDEDSND